MINEAIHFATVCHQKQTRKGTDIPYILHCLEAGTIAASLTNQDGQIDTDVVAAAILHDTIEDAHISYRTLKKAFNANIAYLVNFQSEDKSKPWVDRKQHTIDLLQNNTSKAIEIAMLSDKLSNIRSIFKEYQIKKIQLWEKFNAGKELQHWYYNAIADSLSQVKDTAEYKEFRELISAVFKGSDD